MLRALNLAQDRRDTPRRVRGQAMLCLCCAGGHAVACPYGMTSIRLFAQRMWRRQTIDSSHASAYDATRR